MPIYEYQCASCGHQLEVIQKVSDEPLRDCPECGEGALSKLVSAAGFRLGGSGWYETDFKSKNKRNLKDGDSGDGGKPGNNSESKDKGKDKGKESGKPEATKANKAAAAAG